MTLFMLTLSILGYSLAGMFVKTYYKLYKCDSYSPEDAYIVGIFWPVYAVYRLLAWPLGTGSRFIEAKMVSIQKLKEESKKKTKARVALPDRDYREAELEVEEMLSPKNERYSSL